MAYGQWIIDEVFTTKEFGYSTIDLKINSHQPVKVICLECGCKATKEFRFANRKHRCKSIIDGNKKCYKCKETKEVNENFSKNRSAFDGYQKVCKNCFANYDCVKEGYQNKTKKYKTDLLVYFSAKVSYCKDKTKRLNLPFDLDKHFLLELYNKQNGKCFYTKIDMRHNIGVVKFDSISIERLDPTKGYTKDNVVLCCFAINSFKGSLHETDFKEFLRKILPEITKYTEESI